MRRVTKVRLGLEEFRNWRFDYNPLPVTTNPLKHQSSPLFNKEHGKGGSVQYAPVSLVPAEHICVRFVVFTAVTMKKGIFWYVTPCGSCKNRRFRGT
jgi:hypothetical protein